MPALARLAQVFAVRQELQTHSPEEARVRALRAHLARHNRLVLLSALLTLCVAALLWVALYAVLYWLALLWSSAVQGLDAQPPSRDFLRLFLGSGAALVLLAWLAQRWETHPFPNAEESLLAAAAGLPLALPRATLAIFGNLQAWQHLRDRELRAAAAFLETLAREQRIPAHRIALELPDPATRPRILLALQITGLIRISQIRGELWFLPILSSTSSQQVQLPE